MTETTPLWTPSAQNVADSNLTAFARHVESAEGITLPDYWALLDWSRAKQASFYQSVWDFGRVVAETRGTRALIDADQMPGAQWFPDARLNFAENLLRRRDDRPALIFQGERGDRRLLSFADLYNRVSQLALALRADGVVAGDRVVGFMPNLPETVVAMLAATSLGATWSSCSPDFGVKGVMDRFGQIEPTVLFTADGYFYANKQHNSLIRIGDIAMQLPSLRRLVVVPYVEPRPSLTGLPHAIGWEDYLAPHAEGAIDFAQLPFSHPLYIMYSSGTTGAPKCIVHGAGGTLLQHLKEHLLHTDLRRDDRLFYFTTCGWMMWNWLVSGLACGATLVLFDGSPFEPDANTLWSLAEREKVDIFGSSAKFYDACTKAEIAPIKTHDLSRVRTILSTGSVLSPASFDYVYRSIKQDVRLSSVSGGTDLLGCFAAGATVLPVYSGEIQTRVLGMSVEIFDESGQPVQGQKGELVCTKPFPSMPVGFWDDPDGNKYRNAYFEMFHDVWTHGDYCELTDHGGIIIYGRSDAVLNPGGVRIGTAEIYRQVEQMVEIEEGLCVGQDWDNDVRVVLFVRLRGGVVLDDMLCNKIKANIRANATPRHVPAKIVAVADIPRTISGKITELAVRDIVHGRSIKNIDALANPEALRLFENVPELQV